jgi:hypothetical protein
MWVLLVRKVSYGCGVCFLNREYRVPNHHKDDYHHTCRHLPIVLSSPRGKRNPYDWILSFRVDGSDVVRERYGWLVVWTLM